MLKKYAAVTGFVIRSVLVLSFAGAAFATCKVKPETVITYPFQAELTERECNFVAYKQGGKIEVVVEYPEMRIVETKTGSDKDRMTLQFWYVPMPEDGVDRAVIDVPLLAGPITSFRAGRNRVSTFLGRDGREVYVNENEAVNSVERKFAINIQGTYQYSVEHTDIKAMDDFALGFFKKMMGGNMAVE